MNTTQEVLRVGALTQGVRIPSSRFRVSQHVAGLRGQRVEISELPARHGAYPPFGLWKRLAWLPVATADAYSRVRQCQAFDVCLLQRELVSTLLTAEHRIRVPLVFDVDDAIYLHHRGRATDRIAQHARVVVCGNRTLAEHYGSLADVEIIPTAVDTERFTPASPADGPPRIGWTGSSSGFSYLEHIVPAVRSLMDLQPDCRFVVMADRRPSLNGLPPHRVDFLPWSEDQEVPMLQSLSVGLMPLRDDPWSRGKCSFKMICYMACGIPVVVSPVGMNADVLKLGKVGFAANTSDEWTQAMQTLLQDRSAAQDIGRTGRQVVEHSFSTEVVGQRLAAVLRNAAR